MTASIRVVAIFGAAPPSAAVSAVVPRLRGGTIWPGGPIAPCFNRPRIHWFPHSRSWGGTASGQTNRNVRENAVTTKVDLSWYFCYCRRCRSNQRATGVTVATTAVKGSKLSFFSRAILGGAMDASHKHVRQSVSHPIERLLPGFYPIQILNLNRTS